MTQTDDSEYERVYYVLIARLDLGRGAATAVLDALPVQSLQQHSYSCTASPVAAQDHSIRWCLHTTSRS